MVAYSHVCSILSKPAVHLAIGMEGDSARILVILKCAETEGSLKSHERLVGSTDTQHIQSRGKQVRFSCENSHFGSVLACMHICTWKDERHTML